MMLCSFLPSPITSVHLGSVAVLCEDVKCMWTPNVERTMTTAYRTPRGHCVTQRCPSRWRS